MRYTDMHPTAQSTGDTVLTRAVERDTAARIRIATTALTHAAD